MVRRNLVYTLTFCYRSTQMSLIDCLLSHNGIMNMDNLCNWSLHTASGKMLVEEEIRLLAIFYPQLFGYHILQVGSFGAGKLLQGSRIANQHLLAESAEMPTLNPLLNIRENPNLHEDRIFTINQVIAPAEVLPFKTDSIDVVVLPHVLEFSLQPHEILREVERILIAEGHLILTGFNPFSLMSILRLFHNKTAPPPWNGHFYSTLRVKDWLSLLGFELISQQNALYMLPYTGSNSFILPQYLQCFSSIYTILAKKRCIIPPPMNKSWIPLPHLKPDGEDVAPEPTTYVKE